MKKWLAIFLSCLFIFPMALMPNMASAADGDFGGYVVKELNYNSVNGLYTIGSSGLLINPALVFTTPIDLEKLGYVDGDGKIKSNLALQMDLFMDGNLTALKAGVGQIEFTSSGTCDKEEINTSVAGMQWKEGEWVRQAIPLSTFGNGSADSSAFDPSAINYMRIYIVGMEKFAGEIMRLKICNVRLVDTSKTAPTPEQDRIGDGSFIPDAPVWELAPIGGDYTTTDDVVMGYNLKDYLNDEYFEGKDPAKDDVTPIIQSLLDGLEQAGGGTLFIPAGEYHMEGSLNIPKGVTLCGEWSQPDGKSPVKGTIFKIYNGKGDAGGRPFISLTNNCMVRNVTFWYPEQKLENGNPIAYPPTILGGSYSHVRNVTFVNSFVAVQQGPTMSGCPNVYNAYGTPLMTGFDIDGIADIGRYDTINFAPDYWINSGLAGAPSTEEEIEKLKESLGSQAVGIILRRIDWSYLAFYNVTGYARAFRSASPNARRSSTRRRDAATPIRTATATASISRIARLRSMCRASAAPVRFCPTSTSIIARSVSVWRMIRMRREAISSSQIRSSMRPIWRSITRVRSRCPCCPAPSRTASCKRPTARSA